MKTVHGIDSGSATQSSAVMMSAHAIPDEEDVLCTEPRIPRECMHDQDRGTGLLTWSILGGSGEVEFEEGLLQPGLNDTWADEMFMEQALDYLTSGDENTAGLPDLATEQQVTRLPHRLTGRIPFEVVELIVDTMPQGSLATCALVCRAWNHAILRIIYREITVSHRTALDSLVNYIRRDIHAAGRLQQTHTLRIIGAQPRTDCDPPTHVVPLVLGRGLPNVSRLVFVSSLRPQMHSSFFSTLSLFRGVTALELLRFRLHSFRELRRIISAGVSYDGPLTHAYVLSASAARGRLSACAARKTRRRSERE